MARPKSLTITVDPDKVRKYLEDFTALNRSPRKAGEGFQSTELDRLVAYMIPLLPDMITVSDRPPAPPIPMWVAVDRSGDTPKVSVYKQKREAPQAWMSAHNLTERNLAKIPGSGTKAPFAPGEQAYVYTYQVSMTETLVLQVMREDRLSLFLTDAGDLATVQAAVDAYHAEHPTESGDAGEGEDES